MKTELLYSLHERQSAIIDMIKRCDKVISIAQEDLKKEVYRIMLSKELYKVIRKYNNIKLRLIQYYLDIQKRIIAMQPTIELNTITEQDLVTEKS